MATNQELRAQNEALKKQLEELQAQQQEQVQQNVIQQTVGKIRGMVQPPVPPTPQVQQPQVQQPQMMGNVPQGYYMPQQVQPTPLWKKLLIGLGIGCVGGAAGYAYSEHKHNSNVVDTTYESYTAE